MRILPCPTCGTTVVPKEDRCPACQGPIPSANGGEPHLSQGPPCAGAIELKDDLPAADASTATRRDGSQVLSIQAIARSTITRAGRALRLIVAVFLTITILSAIVLTDTVDDWRGFLGYGGLIITYLWALLPPRVFRSRRDQRSEISLLQQPDGLIVLQVRHLLDGTVSGFPVDHYDCAWKYEEPIQGLLQRHLVLVCCYERDGIIYLREVRDGHEYPPQDWEEGVLTPKIPARSLRALGDKLDLPTYEVDDLVAFERRLRTQLGLPRKPW